MTSRGDTGGAGGGSRGVETEAAPPYLILRLAGARGGAGLNAALAQAAATPADTVVVEFGGTPEVGLDVDGLAAGLAALLRSARRVTLVRCPGPVAEALWSRGVRSVAHAPTLAAATAGRARGPEHSVDLFVRSEPEALERVRRVARAVAACGAPAGWPAAVAAAAAHAIEHGSPEGPRNHVRLSFARGERLLVVDVADQRGEAPPGPPPALGGGAGTVEHLPGGPGAVLRLTTRLAPR